MNVLGKLLSLALLFGGLVLMIYGNFSQWSHATGGLMLAGGTVSAIAGLATTVRSWKYG